MQCEQRQWTAEGGWRFIRDLGLRERAHLVIAFGSNAAISNPGHFDEIRKMYPQARILSGSTAGEILDARVHDGSLALTAIAFDRTRIDAVETKVEKGKKSEEVGKELGTALPKEGLVHAMVFSDGLSVNGTALVAGLLASLPATVSVTGGLMGGGSEFKETFVGLDHTAERGRVVLIGFYGSGLKVGYGSLGGWDPFGPDRVITKSKENVLFELDGKPALALYKEYLGDQAAGLPGTGLLFPMQLLIPQPDGTKREVVRTLLAVDEKAQSMTFAGDMLEGVTSRLMKANFDRLVDGAEGAAALSIEPFGAERAELAILISCIGRKLVLKDRIEDETHAVRTKIGDRAAMIGFYSYGEICPTTAMERQCQLHNQTMTITTFREV